MTVNLPEILFVPALRKADSDASGFELLKAVSPEGVSVPIAFTKLEFLRHFAEATGLSGHQPPIGHVQIPAGTLLQQLAESGEPEVCIDPLQESEARLSYTNNGVLSQQIAEENAVFEIETPKVPLDEQHVERLRKVAASLPHVQRVWLMEMAIRDSADDNKLPIPRPLLVVEQDIDEKHDEFQDTWMELGDQWCEHLPRGTAVNMLPHNAPPVKDRLVDSCVVYSRES
jgi:hypothetical protein